MRSTVKSIFAAVGLAAAAAALAGQAAAQESSFGPADAKETYYWISNKANLPLFVQYDYVGMKRIAEELGVKVIVAGPTDFDIPGFISAVNQVCAQKPDGVSVVGGWMTQLPCRSQLRHPGIGVSENINGLREIVAARP